MNHRQLIVARLEAEFQAAREAEARAAEEAEEAAEAAEAWAAWADAAAAADAAEAAAWADAAFALESSRYDAAIRRTTAAYKAARAKVGLR